MSFDSVADSAASAQKFDFPFPLLCDADRSLDFAYGACDDAAAAYAKRSSYLIDEEGKFERVYASVSARSRPTEVLGDLV